jgi:hypothetical protein
MGTSGFIDRDHRRNERATVESVGYVSSIATLIWIGIRNPDDSLAAKTSVKTSFN